MKRYNNYLRRQCGDRSPPSRGNGHVLDQLFYRSRFLDPLRFAASSSCRSLFSIVLVRSNTEKSDGTLR